MTLLHQSFAFISILILASASQAEVRPTQISPQEVEITELKLAPPLNDRDAEFSGLTWCQDELWLLPQYPERLVKDGKKVFYAIDKHTILSALSSPSSLLLAAKRIEVFENGIRQHMSFLETFEGYEAIACDGDTVWLSIETRRHLGQIKAYLVPALIQRNDKRTTVSIEADKVRPVVSQSQMSNKGEEAILIYRDHLISLHELSDRRAVKKPVATWLHTVNGNLSSTKIASTSYRTTDATSVDDSGRFWIANYHYSGDELGLDDNDQLASKYGIGKTHNSNYNVERIVELQIQPNGEITHTKRAPIQLKLTSKEGRNWEGIVRLDNLGFLLITDRYPGSMLAFVSYTFNNDD